MPVIGDKVRWMRLSSDGCTVHCLRWPVLVVDVNAAAGTATVSWEGHTKVEEDNDLSVLIFSKRVIVEATLKFADMDVERVE